MINRTVIGFAVGTLLIGAAFLYASTRPTPEPPIRVPKEVVQLELEGVELDSAYFTDLQLGVAEIDYTDRQITPVSDIASFPARRDMQQDRLILSCQTIEFTDLPRPDNCDPNPATPVLNAYADRVVVPVGGETAIYLALDRPGATPLTGLTITTLDGRVLHKTAPQTSAKVVFEPCIGFFGSGCGFRQSVTFTAPSDLPPAPYVMTLEAKDARAEVLIFVTQTSDAPRDLVVSIPDWTIAAYNRFGGGSLYRVADEAGAWASIKHVNRLTRASLHRPIKWDGHHGIGPYAKAVAMLQAEGFGVTTCDQIAMDTGACPLASDDTLVVIGHNEYWSQAIFDQIEAHLASGGPIVNFSGNIAWWRTVRVGRDLQVDKNRRRDKQWEGSGLFPDGYRFNAKDPPKDPPSRLFGVSYRTAGYPLNRVFRDQPLDPVDVMARKRCDHPIFAGLGVENGALFLGADKVVANGVELDGALLTEDGALSEEQYFGPKAETRLLATARAGRNPDVVRDIGFVTEFLPFGPDAGRVLTLGSIGAVAEMARPDTEVAKMLLNAIAYVKAPDPSPVEGCAWERLPD